MINKKRKIEVKDLNEHLTCVLCDGYFIDATTITDCLHTFCRSCIRKELNIKPNCPSCEKKDPNFCPKSSPKLRQDRILQNLVYKIVPGLYQRELSNRMKFVKENSGLDDHIVRWSDEVPRDKRALASPGFSKEEIFSICLRRQTSYSMKDGDSSADIQSFLSCPGHVRISALKKFVLMKLGLLKDWQVIFFNAFDSFSDGCTLVDVAYIKRWDKISPLVLDYYLINPYQNCLQLTRSAKKRPRTDNDIKRKSSANNSVRITESSPTSGIKIRIKLSESIRKEGHLLQRKENNLEESSASMVSSAVDVKQEMFSPQKEKDTGTEETNNELEEGDDDFEPPSKRVRSDESTNVNNNINSNNNNNDTQTVTNLTSFDSISSKKKPGRPKRKGSTHGKLSILSLLKRRWSQEPQIKKELMTSPEKNPESTNTSFSAVESGNKTGLKSILSESVIGDRANHLSNGANENPSIVTFREDNPGVVQVLSPSEVNPKENVASMILPQPVLDNTSLNANVDGHPNNPELFIGSESISKNCKNADFGVTFGNASQLKFTEVPSFTNQGLAPIDLQKLLLLAQQPNLLVHNPEILAAYNQKLCELLASQNFNVHKPPEGTLPLQQSPVQIASNLHQGQASAIHSGDMFSINKQPQVPEYLSNILYGQQVPQMLLSYPQLPLQPFVISPGYECNLMQNILHASNQKPVMETTSLSPEQIASLAVPLPYNFVYPSAPPQFVPDCSNYYLGQPLQQMGNPFENNLPKPAHHFSQGYDGDKMLRDKSFLTTDGISAIGMPLERASGLEQLTNQVEGLNGCSERPLFSPMSVDEDDRRAGLIPESALDPSKEIGMEKCDVLMNGSQTSDVSV